MISVIIPVLNEATTLPKLLHFLTEEASKAFPYEILVVDGGSTDDTTMIVKKFDSQTNIHLINSEKGRAKQMNAGAAKAKGTILYFLHADTFPPKNFAKQIRKAIDQSPTAGCFRMKFDSKHPVLVCSAWFTRFNLKACRGGDQSLFVTKPLFEALGGFDSNYVVYEDCEFINRLYKHGTFTIIPDYVTTSARKYKVNGTTKLQYHFMVIHLKKFLGASPKELYHYYKKKIAS